MLYSNSSGSNSTITLSESAANFNFMKIYYRDNDSVHNSCEVQSPNGKTACLMNLRPSSSGTNYIKSCQVSISGTSITPSRYSEISFSSGSTPSISNSNRIYITKVVGN